MKLLAIETSSSLCSLALQVDDEIISIHQNLPMQQAKAVLPLLSVLLKIKKISLRQLDAIAFGQGPGSFTGIRIATSIVQGLAYAISRPVLPISSLAAMAQTVFLESGWRKQIIAIDARVQEVYWGTYEIQSNGLALLLGEETVAKPSQVNVPYADDFYGVGNAWSIYEKQMDCRPKDLQIHCFPTATGILTLAREKYLKKEWSIPSKAQPIYLRNQVTDVLSIR